MREFRWPVIVATAIAALIIFFGALFLYQRHYIEGPFLDSLEQMEGIESVELEQGRRRLFSGSARNGNTGEAYRIS